MPHFGNIVTSVQSVTVLSFSATHFSKPVILIFKDEPVEGHPVWPMIYYCLRCGDLQAAADIAQQAVAPNVREFSGYIREYASHGHLTETSVRNMKYAYRKEVRNSLDPFKRYI